MKTVGIIGGLGPETTAKFYLELINRCGKIDQSRRPRILLWNVPVEKDVEKNFLLAGKNSQAFLPLLIDGARRLEKGGADFLVLPCNSLHVFLSEIRRSVAIPVLDIIELSLKRIENLPEVGILSTEFTKKTKLFKKKGSVKLVFPNDEDQKELNKIIRQLVIGKNGDESKKNISEILSNLQKRGVTNIILACTDLQLINTNNLNIRFFDTFKILIEETVKEIFSNYRAL